MTDYGKDVNDRRRKDPINRSVKKEENNKFWGWKHKGKWKRKSYNQHDRRRAKDFRIRVAPYNTNDLIRKAQDLIRKAQELRLPIHTDKEIERVKEIISQ